MEGEYLCLPPITAKNNFDKNLATFFKDRMLFCTLYARVVIHSFLNPVCENVCENLCDQNNFCENLF